MLDLTLFYTSITILTIVYISLGYYASRITKDKKEFFLANRSLGFISITFSLVATQLGGGAILGVSELSYQYGIVGIFYTLGLSIGMICVSFFGAAQLRLKEISTIAELFEKEYQSPFLRKIASLFSIISLLGIFVAIVVSSRKFLIGLGIDSRIFLYIFWISLALYTIIGGIRAVVYTDILQLIIIFLFFITALVYLVIINPNYITDSFANLFIYPAEKPDIDFSSLILMPFLFIFIEQDMAQKFFAAKSPKIAKLSSFVAGIVLLSFSLIPAILGISARNIGYIPQEASIMMYSLSLVSNKIILVLISIAVLSAIISTADSLLCAVTSNIMLDFNFSNSSSNQLKLTRIITAALSIFAIFIAEYFDKILELMIYSYEIMICALFIPCVLCYFDKIKKDKISASISIAAGFSSYLLYNKLNCVDIIPRVLFCVLTSLTAYTISIFIVGNNKMQTSK